MGKDDLPIVFVAFGATGDLMRLKVLPALFELFREGKLPRRFCVIGFSHRKKMTRAGFRRHAEEVIRHHFGKGVSDKALRGFLELLEFQQGEFDERKSYALLRGSIGKLERGWGSSAHRMFYLASAPHFYESIVKEIFRAGLAQGRGKRAVRLLVEKPFGSDGKSAEALTRSLERYFPEENIYRLDHYLAKEMLQNILPFRFFNNFLEEKWNNRHIERIHIRLIENIGVEKRGASYDRVGAFRDVGQSHFLQMLSLLTMERPAKMSAKAIRFARAKALRSLNITLPKNIRSETFRAQYRGYREIAGVDPDSQTETYFKVRASLASMRWSGVPVVMEGGKRLGKPLKEIVVAFRHPSSCECPKEGHIQNRLVIRMEPKEEIFFEFASKAPGDGRGLHKSRLHFLLRKRSSKTHYTEEYKKLILDVLAGDQTLFISAEENRAMWRFTDPIVKGWQEGLAPLHIYTPDTQKILDESMHVENILPPKK